ncbi:MAG: LLM class F420-dependent oxidoreductase [Gammaproteobacteria bacterium]|uniref:LLM class F420-dependent oxidoreductase n=1 Tax=OM182 bacterium MED-G24 TaxID=1986255 RepID=A0A2A5WTQ4_9GAMM|nr:LLM class F420-dependent oxidoreductase [Gammaproteobacteria bacterium]PDH39643.1 MAG: LLM class F420-dependent oxidoreductase [OM182 bacterium MED-G24]RPG25517.1 MAG: LLM class F420-dependent oxidoreductase [Gammaproteobacteria bacterium TMED50]|tara:strand:+ start:2644 stop:3678 length:1035 start_codon:yes stop_codon:yes gene_type:complete
MKLGIVGGYSGRRVSIDIDRIRAAESMGYESIWTAEAYGSDAVSPAAWILAQTDRIKVGTAIMQMPARSPACTAMTAMTLNQMSEGRFMLGLGASGPQVAEGWHGVAYGRPITRLKEYIGIVRQIMAREAPLEHEGFHYSLPYSGDDGTGLGKPLKSILAPDTEIPIYSASITPAGLAASAEVADGVFPIWMDPSRYDVFEPSINKGLAKADKTLLQYDVAPFVTCVMGDDLDQCRMPIKGNMALYIGGMGARDKNFYNDYAKALGFEDAAVKIQDLYLEGRKDEAMAAVPDELVDAVHLVGPAERIRERLQEWKKAGINGHVGSMLISSGQLDALELIAGEIL